MTTWADNGHVRLDSIIDESTWDALESEARGLYPQAQQDSLPSIRTFRDGSFCSPARFSSHKGGPVFRSVMQSREVLAAVREATQLPRLVPVRCGYNFYRRGDFLGPHRDSVKATVTVLVGLTDNLGQMGWAPDHRQSTNDDVITMISEEDLFVSLPSQGMPITHRSAQAFDGYNIPHWRMPFDHELGILGTFCYFDL
ncbi:hypothetical protein HLB23_02450 [Nocardia uniformis]|uniref:Fe2OG dioxygenase domain-containing protein n=1 Tax=Nocardia uniformis TaxID=53432 RepID=A0A849C174_9NOCA|nr:hypothetical protein [Nocardia uniformis]NNH68749.1 hypothetical protein [Nocardia uniformis]